MTRSRLRTHVVMVLAAAGFVWAGCASATDDTLNRLPSSTAPDVVADAKPDTGPAGTCDCATVGDWYRFTVLAIDTLAGNADNALLGLLNGIWAKDIAAYGLNVMVEVTEVTDTEVRLRAVSGARVGGRDSQEVCVLPGTDSEAVLPRAGCELQDSEPTGINIYAGSTTRVKNCAPGLTPMHAIPARDLVLTATVANDCGSLTGGKVVSGVITEDALDSVCSCVNDDVEDCFAIDPDYPGKGGHCVGCEQGFAHLKGLLQAPPSNIKEFACTSLDGEPALCITAHFEAVRMETSPSPCP